jgi:MoaA/NifB/PqqE/SkfB family radical SAM enzyme
MEWEKAIIVPMSYDCDLNCLFCGTYGKRYSFSFEGLKKLIDKAKNEDRYVILTGGEPLLSKFFLRVLEEVKNKNVKCVIETNGFALSKKRILSNLSSYLDSQIVFDILIEGYNSNMHDFLVGKKAFYSVKKLLDFLNNKNLPFYTHTVMVKPNYRFLDRIAGFVSSIGTRYHRFIFPLPIGRAQDHFDSMIPFASMVAPDLKKAIQVLDKRGKGCHVEGVPPCYFYPEKIAYPDIISVKHNLTFAHSYQCENCRIKGGCKGFFTWYYKHKSNDDLWPVK